MFVCLFCLFTKNRKVFLLVLVRSTFNPLSSISTEASKIYIALYFLMGSFVTSWINHLCILGVNYFRNATPEGLPLLHVFSPFVNNSHCSSLESQGIRNTFLPFSRMKKINVIFPDQLLNCSRLDLVVGFMMSDRFCLGDFLIAQARQQPCLSVDKAGTTVIMLLGLDAIFFSILKHLSELNSKKRKYLEGANRFSALYVMVHGFC